MKTSNYLAKLPQEATIKSIQVFKDYDLISLDVPTASQRLCPHCGSDDCVIKDSGTIQTVRHIPCNHRGTVVSFHKRRLLCKDCHSSFYETPYWIHPFLRMTQALYDSILLDLINLSPSPRLQDATTFHKALCSLSFSSSISAFLQSSPRLSVLTNSKATAVYGVQSLTAGIAINTTAASLTVTPIPSSTSWIRSLASI